MDAASLAVERKDFERIPNPDVLIHRPKEFAKQLTIHEYLGYDHTFTVLFYATWLYTENLDADPLNKAIGYRDMLYSIKKNKRDKYTLATDMSDLMLIHRYTDAIDIYLSTEKDLLDVSKGKLIKKPSHIFFAISKYMMGDASYYPIAYSGLEYWYRHSLRWSEDGIKTGFIPDWKRLKWAYFYHTICKGTDDIRLILNNLKGYN